MKNIINNTNKYLNLLMGTNFDKLNTTFTITYVLFISIALINLATISIEMSVNILQEILNSYILSADQIYVFIQNQPLTDQQLKEIISIIDSYDKDRIRVFELVISNVLLMGVLALVNYYFLGHLFEENLLLAIIFAAANGIGVGFFVEFVVDNKLELLPLKGETLREYTLWRFKQIKDNPEVLLDISKYLSSL